MRLRFKIGKHMFSAMMNVKIYKDVVQTRGIANNTQDGLYVLFLDYDTNELQTVIEPELRRLQKKYDTGTIHLLKTRKGYHAISFAKYTYLELWRIMGESSIDKQFIGRHGKRRWILRIDKKGKAEEPTYLKSLSSETSRERSKAHYRAYSALYPQILEDEAGMDENMKIWADTYWTHGDS